MCSHTWLLSCSIGYIHEFFIRCRNLRIEVFIGCSYSQSQALLFADRQITTVNNSLQGTVYKQLLCFILWIHFKIMTKLFKFKLMSLLKHFDCFEQCTWVWKSENISELIKGAICIFKRPLSVMFQIATDFYKSARAWTQERALMVHGHTETFNTPEKASHDML